ncbi:hypothetical protein BASA61_009964 [Batrachochytrium salamandrivorans]|nr:hypothetical protein BASA61_009964 [Batrachochytrium salamandrivorans]
MPLDRERDSSRIAPTSDCPLKPWESCPKSHRRSLLSLEQRFHQKHRQHSSQQLCRIAVLFSRTIRGQGKTLGLVLAVLSKPHPSVFSLRSTSQPLDFTTVLQKPTIPPELLRGVDPGHGSLLDDPSEHHQSAQLLLRKYKYLSTLMILPTRELAIQTMTWMRKLTASTLAETGETEADIFQCVIAGVDIEEQASQLRKTTPRILIGTPMRLHELYEKKAFDVSRLQLLIVDEVDRIVDAPTRYETTKCKLQRLRHPLAGDRLIGSIVSQRQPIHQTMATREKHVSHMAASGRYLKPRDMVMNRSSITDKNFSDFKVRFDPAQARPLQIVASSATANSALRLYLTKSRKWMLNPVIIDMNSAIQVPTAIKHRAFVVDRFGNAHQLGKDQMETLEKPYVHTTNHTPIHKSNKGKNDPNSIVSPRSTATNAAATHAKVYKGKLEENEGLSSDVLDDDHDLMVETLADFIIREKVEHAFVFTRASVSMARLVDRLQSLGIKADKFFNLVNYAGSSPQSSVIGLTKDVVASPTKALKNGPPSLSDPRPESKATSLMPFQRFIDGEVNVICATEHEARGLDLPTVNHVFILGAPSSSSNYVHMAGRASRYGRSGTVTTLLGGERLVKKYNALIRQLHVNMDET